MKDLSLLLKKIRQCRLCASALPLEPRPILRAHPNAQLLIVGQAPGIRVHETGIPWNDPSGDRLRNWLQLPRESFYNESNIAIIPMGYCYPGTGKSGDLPPRKECAEHWLTSLLALLPNLQLTLLIGSYAQNYYLKERKKNTLTLTVRNFSDYLPKYFPLPHPSPRNNIWFKKNPWFDQEVVPVLRAQTATIFKSFNKVKIRNNRFLTVAK